jgi:hypothetical protein
MSACYQGQMHSKASPFYPNINPTVPISKCSNVGQIGREKGTPIMNIINHIVDAEHDAPVLSSLFRLEPDMWEKRKLVTWCFGMILVWRSGVT